MDEVRIFRWLDRMDMHRDNFLVALTYYASEKETIPRNEEKLKNEEKNLTQQFRILKSDFEWLEKNIFLGDKWREESTYCNGKMSEENFYELDKLVIDYWLKHNDVSLADISNHLNEESLVCGNFSKNFEKIMQRKMSFGEEFQIDVDYEVEK